MSRPTQDAVIKKGDQAYWAITPSTASLSSDFCHRQSSIFHGPITPLAPRRQRFGLRPVRSPLLGVSLLFSFPAGNEMFQFPAFAC